MKNKFKVFMLLLSLFTLCGCKEIQIFETKKDPNAKVELSDKNLEKDTYYVKNGTRFIEVYNPRGNARNFSAVVDKKRVLYFVEGVGDINKVPEHYKGEIVAYASKQTNIGDFHLERFKDLGYSIGVYGGAIENDGYYHINLENDGIVENSELCLAFLETDSKEIRIKAINDQPVTEAMIDSSSGVFKGLNANETYTVSFFSGTYYYETEIKADTLFLQSYEIYSYGDAYLTDTLNGYMAFETPEVLKSGWYNINGTGVFKYYSFEKGEKNLSEVNMNENFYASEEEMIAACSSEYFFEIDEQSANLEIKIEEDNQYSYKDITAYVYSPNKTKYDMFYDEEEKALKANISEAIAGKWKINVIPKNIVMNNIQVNVLETKSELTLVEQTVTIDKEDDNICFCIDYEGTGTVNGAIITPSGETYLMEKGDTFESDKGAVYTKLQYVFKYVEPGDYSVRIYHYPTETKIGTPYTEKEGGNTKDVIIITN